MVAGRFCLDAAAISDGTSMEADAPEMSDRNPDRVTTRPPVASVMLVAVRLWVPPVDENWDES